MKPIFKPMLLLMTAGLLLTGCASGLDPNTFTVELNTEDTSNWWSGSQVANVITIRSNIPEPISVTNVSINNGQCNYEGYRRKVDYPQHFKMGQRLRLQLKGCSYDNVVRVDVETENGTASYSFQ
ncbi:hypothetical protein [Acinetobacter zhairhuonensis]|uniref:hypothetical protein n=1 Tax=Acinetobacter sp. A7.4 TaxID=2919921 RepID=UPI001F4F9D0F|nr:hypothetical protein [Acinetobacter sp. A7.4]MCJ8161985.1 hypothetical protein [Acinetobacter sp. A7.4]